jgi:hypothetical protein
MQTLELPQKVNISNKALFQEIENEMVILDLAKEQYYGLDDVGAKMWHLLSEHGDTTVVVKHLQSYYEADEITLSRDLAQLIEKLRQAGLVTTE